MENNSLLHFGSSLFTTLYVPLLQSHYAVTRARIYHTVCVKLQSTGGTLSIEILKAKKFRNEWRVAKKERNNGPQHNNYFRFTKLIFLYIKASPFQYNSCDNSILHFDMYFSLMKNIIKWFLIHELAGFELTEHELVWHRLI